MQYGADVPPEDAPPSLFDRLLDDAAMFPPGNADAGTAIAEHLDYRAGPLDRYVGPLLVHADRWPEVGAAHVAAGSPPLEVVVLGATTPPGPVPGLRVVGAELPVPALPLPTSPEGLPVACEVTADDTGLAVLEAIASSGRGDYVGKFRTGGTTASAFPDEAQLARIVVAAARTGTPMKYTAGLHHAVRFRDTVTGFEHHGFLNLLVAVQGALTGASERDVADVLARRAATTLVDAVRGWSTDEVAAVRRSFVSFGCCGVGDPVDDLVALGLVTFAKEA